MLIYEKYLEKQRKDKGEQKETGKVKNKEGE
jgi:hypothetical protein